MDDDVSIDLTDEILPHGSPMLTSAIKRVLSVVKALPGAGWVDVQSCPETPHRLPWLAVYRPEGPNVSKAGSGKA